MYDKIHYKLKKKKKKTTLENIKKKKKSNMRNPMFKHCQTAIDYLNNTGHVT